MELRYIEAPNRLNGDISVFCAGGITGCPDWQKDMRALLADMDMTLLNPRRANFDTSDPNASEKQIIWEHEALNAADGILFWFPCETLCPITLYELGRWSVRSPTSQKPVWVGVHPDYKRKVDVEIQTRLAAPNIPVVYSLEDLAAEVRDGMRQYGVCP